MNENFNFFSLAGKRARLECGRSGFEPRSGQTKDYLIFCCFSAKHGSLLRKNKVWLGRYQDNVSECCFNKLALLQSS